MGEAAEDEIRNEFLAEIEPVPPAPKDIIWNATHRVFRTEIVGKRSRAVASLDSLKNKTGLYAQEHRRLIQMYDDVLKVVDGAITDAVAAEREAIANKAREWAANYPEASDGRNTFVLLAEWIESRT